MLQSPATTTQFSTSLGSEEASRSLHTFREEPESGVFSSHKDAIAPSNESKSVTAAIICNGKNESNGMNNKLAITDNKVAISRNNNDHIEEEAIDNTYNDTTTVTIKEKLVSKTANDQTVNDDATSQTTVLVEFHEETDEEEIHSDFVNH